MIIGKNGSGKTTFLDAISFGLFNKPFRKINKPQLVNTITGKDCIVEVEFEVNGYELKVRRGIKPNFFEIYKDGILLPQTPDVRDQQDAFEKYLLKIDHKTFCQIVMLGSAIFIPFMALQTYLRREVIEDLLDLKIFTRMNLLLKSKYTTIDSEIREYTHKKQLAESKLELTTQHYDEIKERIEQEIKSLEESLIEDTRLLIHFTERSAALDIEQNELVKEIKKYSNKKGKKLQSLHSQLKFKCQQVNQEIDFFNNHEICPTCAQVIDEDTKVLTLESKYTLARELTEGLEKLDEQIKSETEREEEAVRLSKISVSKHQEWFNASGNVKFYEQSISNKTKKIEELKNQLNKKQESVNLDELNAELITLDQKLISLSEDKHVMNTAYDLLKDNGIKAQFVKIYIPIINSLIQKYLTDLDFFVEFQLDENFNETIRSRFRDEFSYESFSEGEKARLNVAILMTWRALAKMRGSMDCNLLILDELLDGPLDAEGLDEILKLLSNLTDKENVYIISHKEDQVSDRFGRTLKFVKERNFSRISE